MGSNRTPFLKIMNGEIFRNELDAARYMLTHGRCIAKWEIELDKGSPRIAEIWSIGNGEMFMWNDGGVRRVIRSIELTDYTKIPSRR